MPEIIMVLFLIIPAVLGMAEILHFAKMLILSPYIKGDRYSLIVLENEDALFQLKNFFEENNWYGAKKLGKTIVVCKDLSSENYEECRQLAEANGAMLLDYEKLKDLF